MSVSKLGHRWLPLVGLVGVALIVVVGLLARLSDPISTPVIPAEDPYNHMALVREHVRDGSLDPLNEGSRLYPPGMHAFVAAAWIYTGTDLYDLVRLGPAIFGAIGVLGIAILLWRLEGPLAAVAGGLAYALAPEAVFRTTMLAPTALDLALLPFLFLSLVEIVQGRLAWMAGAVPIALFLVFAHPWALTIVLMAGAAFAVAALVLPWSRRRGAPVSALGLGAAVAVVGLAFALGLSGCAGACGPGFADVWEGGPGLNALAPLFGAVAAALAVMLALAARKFQPSLARERPPAIWLRASLSLVLATAVTVVTAVAVADGFPNSVDLVRMFGWALLILGGLAFALLPLVPSPAGYLGGAIAAATYGFVVFNPFDSAFWPQRTAAYFGIGLALLSGVAAGMAPRALQLVATLRASAAAFPRPAVSRRTALYSGALVVALVATTPFVGASPTEQRWYRMFDECQHGALEEVALDATEDPSALVVSGDWQSKLVLAALTPDASRIWFKGDFFISADERNGVLAMGRQVLVVVDPYLWQETPGANTDFLEDPPWRAVGTWCDPDGTGPTVRAYSSVGDGA